MGLGQQTSVGIMSVLEEEEVAALRADLETMKREKEAAQAELARLQLGKEASDAENREHGMRFRRERSWGTSFDRQGGDNSAGRRGTAVPTMGPMWTRGVRTAADSEQSLTYVYRGIVPKLPVECSPSKYIAWEQRFEFFIANQGLRHTISLDAPEIAVISSTNNAYLFDQFGEELVLQHRQVWGYISDATVYAPFESSLYKCNSISDALRMMRKWHLPLYPAERHLLVAELEKVEFMGDKESEIVRFILRQFPERPSHPHALVVGRGCRDGGAAGVGVQRRITIWHLAAVACRSSSSNSSCTTGLATVGLLTSTSVGPMLSLPPDKRDNPNHYSYRHGESIRQEVTGSTAGTPFHHLRLKRCPTPVFSPLRLRRLWRKRPCHQRARHRRQYLQQRRRSAVLFSPLHQWGGRPRAPASDDGTVESAAESAISGTVPSAASVRGEIGRRESFAGVVPSDVAAEAFLLAVRYNNSSNSSNNIISSSNSRGNSSSCSSNDTTSNHDSWWEAIYVGALLRPLRSWERMPTGCEDRSNSRCGSPL